MNPNEHKQNVACGLTSKPESNHPIQLGHWGSTRRQFLRRSGSASVATVIALNGMVLSVRAADSGKPKYTETVTITVTQSSPLGYEPRAVEKDAKGARARAKNNLAGKCEVSPEEDDKEYDPAEHKVKTQPVLPTTSGGDIIQNTATGQWVILKDTVLTYSSVGILEPK
jgi:hypothetical protein